MQSPDEEKKKAIRVNLSRYLFKVEAAIRKENEKHHNYNLNNTASTVSLVDDNVTVTNKIVSKTIITIFMAFLTYSPKDRRDYLKDNINIEEDFKTEAENI